VSCSNSCRCSRHVDASVELLHITSPRRMPTPHAWHAHDDLNGWQPAARSRFDNMCLLASATAPNSLDWAHTAACAAARHSPPANSLESAIVAWAWAYAWLILTNIALSAANTCVQQTAAQRIARPQRSEVLTEQLKGTAALVVCATHLRVMQQPTKPICCNCSRTVSQSATPGVPLLW
jgi:hypothetical protein